VSVPRPASEPSLRSSSRGIYLNGATIMTTSTPHLLETAREAGFIGVEVRSERLLHSLAEVRVAAAVVRPGEAWSLNGLQLQLLEGRALDRERLENELPPRLEICRVLGIPYLLIVPPRGADVDRDHAIGAMQEGIRIARDGAGKVGVRVAFEFLGFGDCPIDTPSLAGAVVEAEPGVDVVLDSCHWHASGSGSLAAFPVDRLVMVHVNDAPAKPPRDVEDADRVLPGAGVIRLAGLLAVLTDRGYRGPFSLETFNPAYWDEDPGLVAGRGLAAMRRLLDEAFPVTKSLAAG
jgi:2-keto-myo-inositol isomerase